jgi:hypothetical protein
MGRETLNLPLNTLPEKLTLTKATFLTIKHNLSLLLQKKDDIYIQITDDPISLEMLPNLTYYLKVRIPENT